MAIKINKSLGNTSTGSLKTTGDSNYEDDSINNIRDLCGNVYELTLEAMGVSERVFRGASCRASGKTSSRSTLSPDNNSYYFFGSRLTLYIK